MITKLTLIISIWSFIALLIASKHSLQQDVDVFHDSIPPITVQWDSCEMNVTISDEKGEVAFKKFCDSTWTIYDCDRALDIALKFHYGK